MPNSLFFAHMFFWCCKNRVGNLDFLSGPATLNQAHVVNNPCFVVVLRFFLSDFFFSACLAVTANTIRDLCAPCKQ